MCLYNKTKHTLEKMSIEMMDITIDELIQKYIDSIFEDQKSTRNYLIDIPSSSPPKYHQKYETNNDYGNVNNIIENNQYVGFNKKEDDGIYLQKKCIKTPQLVTEKHQQSHYHQQQQQQQNEKYDDVINEQKSQRYYYEMIIKLSTGDVIYKYISCNNRCTIVSVKGPFVLK
ncbi:MAG: hypothetical protein [Cotesia congregata filamentous virus 2]